MIAAPNWGGVRAACAAAACHAGRARGHGRSTQSTAVSASTRFEYRPFASRSTSRSPSATSSVPFPANAAVSPSRRYRQNDVLYSAAATPVSRSAELPGCPAIWLRSGLRAVWPSMAWTRATAAVADSPWWNGQADRRRQSAMNDRSATWNPRAWARFMLNPGEPGFSMNLAQARGFQVALRSFIADCLRRSACPFHHGESATAAVARVQAMLGQTARKPLRSQIAGQPGNSALLLTGVAAALYSTSFWRYLREGLTAAFAGNGTLLVALGDLLVERDANGRYSNLVEAETAVDCVDRPWPRALPAWQAAAAQAARTPPQFGAAIMWGSLPCAYWPVHAAPPVRLQGKGAPPILVVGTTRDPATPFRWARALSHDLASGVLLGWNGDGHTAYMVRSSCINSAVDKYLISLVPPRNGTMCP